MELRKFVKEKNATVGEAYLARFWFLAASHERNGRGSLVRCAERPFIQKAVRIQAGRTPDLCDLDRFRHRELRHNAGKRFGKKTFADARRTHQKDIVLPTRRDDERPLRVSLPLDL